jgi:hypothetical protein
MTANLRFCLSAFLASVMCFIAVPIHASPATWAFAPSKVGRALHEGGWTVEYALGQISASPEFSFPLQLIYRNNREQAGMFGSQWWCPQLESTVLPRGRGVLVWTMPSGGMVGFKPDERRAGQIPPLRRLGSSLCYIVDTNIVYYRRSR